MNRNITLLLVLLALSLSACGTGAPATTTTPQGVNPTSQTDGTTATVVPTSMAEQTNGDITTVLANDPRFSTFTKAIDMAKLNDTLRATGPMTIFAPTNDAFAALPAGQLDQLLADPTQLGHLLSYHVVSGTMKAADIMTMTSLPTLDGKPIQVTKDGNGIMLNGTTHLMTTDIPTTNGVIHVIDKVLIPSS